MTYRAARIWLFICALWSISFSLQAVPAYGAAPDLRGSWTGTFSSNHAGVDPFTISLVITSDTAGRVTGNSTLTSKCMKSANLQVTVSGVSVVLAGSDEKGDNLTIRGSLDTTGTLLSSTYILNGSQGGGCETDDGTGTLQKR